MSVFVDTGVFYAAFDRSATRHETARRALTRVLQDAAYGRVVTSEYVYDETVTLTAQRTGDTDLAIAVGERLRGTHADAAGVELVHSSERLFDAAVDAFERFDDHGLSFTDAMTVAIVDRRDFDAVLSFDDDFDGLVDRLAPADVADSAD